MPPLPIAAPAQACPPFAAGKVLEQADRLRGLSAPELARELELLAGLNDGPLRQAQLAAALLLTRVPSDAQRAQALLQQLLERSDAEAASLHPLARLLLAQQAELRRGEEQQERQAQQLRDAQRRIDQLNDRLEAVRALERSLGQRNAPATPIAPASPASPAAPAGSTTPPAAPVNGARPAS